MEGSLLVSEIIKNKFEKCSLFVHFKSVFLWNFLPIALIVGLSSTSSLAMAESIIVGTPVIAARTEEADEYSLGGKLAYLYPMNDVKAFEQTMLDFVHRPEKETLKEKDRGRIAEMFLPQRNILNLNNTLKELVS